MCQLWVNLPRKYKTAKPGYHKLKSEKIPGVDLPLDAPDGAELEGRARIIAGKFDGTNGAAKTFSPVQLWDVSLPKKGAEIEFPFAAHYNCIIFVRRGSVEVLSGGGEGEDLDASRLGPQDVAVMRNDGSDLLKLRVVEKNTSVMIMGGEPLIKPIAPRSFVMNVQQELNQAMLDDMYRNGKTNR